MSLYELLRGPLLWLAFGVFIGGMLVRVILFFTVSTKKDKPIYRFFSWKWLGLSVFHWIVPLNETAKKNPVTTAVGFIFHFCLLARSDRRGPSGKSVNGKESSSIRSAPPWLCWFTNS